MELELRFKCHVYREKGIPDEIRIFAMEQGIANSFDFLNQKLQSIIPGLTKTKCTITWKDPEGDEVVISTDEELKIAVITQIHDLIRLSIYCEDADDSVTADTAAGNSNAHCGVVCDGCDNRVCGFRYKYTTCDDYDSCTKSEAAGLHPEHGMVRVPTPNLCRMIIRAALKRYRHFLKTVGTAVEEERSKKRRVPSSKRKRRGGHGYGHRLFHGYGLRPHKSDYEHHRRQRISWLEILATYMNEFANLARDVDIEIDKSEPKEAQAQSTQTPKEPTSSTTNKQQYCPLRPAIIDVNKIRKILYMYFGGLDPTKLSTSKSSESTKVSETSQSKTKNEEMEQGDRKSPESDNENLNTDKESLTSEISSLAEPESENNYNPDKIDDSVINKEKDLMDSDEKPNEPTPPIGFNLPEEFQERVNISSGRLFDPLNEATDVSHIDAAIDQMIAMGFTNDGGCLTQILESKNGKVVAVLDLLILLLLVTVPVAS